MDSKIVSAAIRKSIRPVLESVGGFTKFSGRTAWRFDAPTVSIVNFQSFNSYVADGVGCTTFSFAVNLGVFYRYEKPVDFVPAEYDCTFRLVLGKSIRQPVFVPYASTGRTERTDRPDIFFVEADGSNLVEVLTDARDALESRGLPALAHLRDIGYAYRLLLEGDFTPNAFGGLAIAPPGTFDSPARTDATLALGHLLGVAEPRADITDARGRRSVAQLPSTRS